MRVVLVLFYHQDFPLPTIVSHPKWKALKVETLMMYQVKTTAYEQRTPLHINLFRKEEATLNSIHFFVCLCAELFSHMYYIEHIYLG